MQQKRCRRDTIRAARACVQNLSTPATHGTNLASAWPGPQAESGECDRESAQATRTALDGAHPRERLLKRSSHARAAPARLRRIRLYASQPAPARLAGSGTNVPSPGESDPDGSA